MLWALYPSFYFFCYFLGILFGPYEQVLVLLLFLLVILVLVIFLVFIFLFIFLSNGQVKPLKAMFRGTCNT